MNIENLALEHYENFPVGSFLMKKKFREPIHLIYAFARTADDIADSDKIDKNEKLNKLDNWGKNLKLSLENNLADDFFIKLSSTIKKFNLSEKFFYDLLIAFKMDANGLNFKNFDELLNYTNHSANPIGRLLLELTGNYTDENKILSDKICTSLQIINFVQDFKEDKKINRSYIPQNILLECKSENLALLKLIEIANKLIIEGKPLINNLNKFLKFEVLLIINSAKLISKKIEKELKFKNFTRPKLNSFDKMIIGTKTILGFR